MTNELDTILPKLRSAVAAMDRLHYTDVVSVLRAGLDWKASGSGERRSLNAGDMRTLMTEITQLRGNLSLAEEGLAAGLQENVRLGLQRDHWLEIAREKDAEIERLTRELAEARELIANAIGGPDEPGQQQKYTGTRDQLGCTLCRESVWSHICPVQPSSKSGDGQCTCWIVSSGPNCPVHDRQNSPREGLASAGSSAAVNPRESLVETPSPSGDSTVTKISCVYREGCRKFPACTIEARCCGRDASIPATR